MVTCETCGHPCTRGEDFCGGCGAYLSWEGEPAQTSPPAAAPPAPVLPPAPVAPPVPVAAPTPAMQPRAVRPGGEEPLAGPPRRAAQPEERPAPGELICGQCGTGNVATRRFCRRCGAPLADAPVAPKPPWWRRLLARRPRPAPAAGERPRRRVLRRPRFVLPLVLLLLLGAGGYAFRGPLASGVELVRDRLATPQQIHPTTIRASTQDPAHPAALAVDGTTDRYWSPAQPGDGTGEFLEADFAGPFRLLDLVIHPGISATAEQFLTQGRPQTLTATLTNAAGRATTRTLNLADTPGEQRFHLAASTVVRIRLTIRSSFGTGPTRHVAIAEVEFFKRP